MISRCFIFILLLIIHVPGLFAQKKGGEAAPWKIYKYEIFEEIAPAATLKTSLAFGEAEKMDADLIILHLNTYGGLVSEADSIRTRILNSKIPVYVFIENNAASAGALISLACHKIFMRKGANIGAATVVDGENGAAAPDKYQSYMRSKMRSTAEARGRNPDVAQAMVDGNIVVPGLNDSGKVVTLTATEAVKWGFCDGKYESIEEMLSGEHAGVYTIATQKLSWTQRATGWLMNPAVSGVLILLILGGIYYELRTPGIGFPLLVSIVSALLYFAPFYLSGLAENWEILLFIAGLILLGLEIFIIPGFGIAGISGLILIFGSLVLSALNNIVFDFSPTAGHDIQRVLLTVSSALFAFVLLVLLTLGNMQNSWWVKKLALSEELPAPAKEFPDLTGLSAVAHTDLRPQGEIMLRGEYFEATTYGIFIPRHSGVKIVGRTGGRLVVEPYEEAGS
jgi:membrane-bound serine protease (ClpP class)